MPASDEQLMTVVEVAEEFKIGRGTVYRLLAARDLAFVPIGERKRLIPRSAVLDWIVRNTQDVDSGA